MSKASDGFLYPFRGFRICGGDSVNNKVGFLPLHKAEYAK
jgi:hypothetical protein